MYDITAEQLIFIDESLFKAQTRQRCLAYSPISQAVCWQDDMRWGDTQSILLIYTVNGYLSYTRIKKGYYNREAFREWIIDKLLPYCNAFPAYRSVIVLDNVNIYLNRGVK